MTKMTDRKRLKSNCLNLFFIVLSILSSYSSYVASQPEVIITQQLQICEQNLPGSTILKFTSSYNSTIDNPEFTLENSNETQKEVKLKKALESNNFVFNITILLSDTIDSNKIIQIKGSFIKNCENSYTSSCTVIIAFLASLCLILFTALALSLIILRRKKPITFKFGQKDDPDYDRKQFSETNYDETYEQTNVNKNPSIDVSNGILIGPKTSRDSPRMSMPRKSSLKPPKSSINEQVNNNNTNYSSHENAAYIGSELEVVEEINEDKLTEEKPNFAETRRKSIVTFSEKTEVNYG